RQLRQLPVRLYETVERIRAAFDDAQPPTEIALRIFRQVINPHHQAARNRLDRRERIGKLMTEHADQTLPRNLLFFLQWQAYVRQHQEHMRSAILAEGGFAQQPAPGAGAGRVYRLVRRMEQVFQAQFVCGSPDAAADGHAEELCAGFVDQLQDVFSIDGKKWRVHDFENARQQRSGFERVHPLFLQQVGDGVYLQGEFGKRVLRAGAARAERVITLPQRGNDVRQRLKRPDHTFDQGRGNEQKINQQA